MNDRIDVRETHMSQNTEVQKIAQWLKKLRFRRALFGVNERHVWKKLAELDQMYQQALWAERIRYDVLLEEYRKTAGLTGDSPPDETQGVVH